MQTTSPAEHVDTIAAHRQVPINRCNAGDSARAWRASNADLKLTLLAEGSVQAAGGKLAQPCGTAACRHCLR